LRNSQLLASVAVLGFAFWGATGGKFLLGAAAPWPP